MIRRQFCQQGLGFFLAVLFAVVPLVAQESPRPEVVVGDAARRLHADALLIDGHNDLPWEMRDQAGLSFDKLDIAQLQPSLHTDIPKLRAGGVGAQFWSVYVPVETDQTGEALRTTLEQIEFVQSMVHRYPETFVMTRTAEEILAARRQGKIACLMGVEGGHSMENSLAVLQRLRNLGVAYMTLTHSKSTPWAASATDESPPDGLTAFGEEVVREMNRLGMLVDLSHVAPETMRDALRVSRAPVIFSHSSARGVADHPRNVPDDILPLVAQNGGVIMVNFYSSFLVKSSAERDVQRIALRRELEKTVNDAEERAARLRRWEAMHPVDPGDIYVLVDHIDHLVRHAGIDHVGLGSDFDGVPVLPRQLESVATYPRITQVLLDRGYAEADVRKILGENVLRVMRRAEWVAEHWNEPNVPAP